MHSTQWRYFNCGGVTYLCQTSPRRWALYSFKKLARISLYRYWAILTSQDLSSVQSFVRLRSIGADTSIWNLQPSSPRPCLKYFRPRHRRRLQPPVDTWLGYFLHLHVRDRHPPLSQPSRTCIRGTPDSSILTPCATFSVHYYAIDSSAVPARSQTFSLTCIGGDMYY